MVENITETVVKRSQVVLDKIQAALDQVDDTILTEPARGWPLWKQFYHTIYWLDHWFIGPDKFEEPGFHEPHYLEPDTDSKNILVKTKLEDYFKAVRTKVETYLSTLTLGRLQEKVKARNLERTRLDIILGQFMHVNHHIGYILSSLNLIKMGS